MSSSDENVADINEMHWALSFGYLVATGEDQAPSDERLSKMSARELMHFEEGKRIASKIEALRNAVKPLAALEIPKRAIGNAGAYSIRHADIQAAKDALAQAS